MRSPHGYMELGQEDGSSKPFDTVQCGHCGRHQPVKPKQDPSEIGGFCRCCMTCLCGSCVAVGVCTPMMKKVEAQEARALLARRLGF